MTHHPVIAMVVFEFVPDHRALHSFPTRRSSDLPRTPLGIVLDTGALIALDRGNRRMIALLQRDRKSTRLNSSHPSISYAVFCLKKKSRLLSPTLNAHSRGSACRTALLWHNLIPY